MRKYGIVVCLFLLQILLFRGSAHAQAPTEPPEPRESPEMIRRYTALIVTAAAMKPEALLAALKDAVATAHASHDYVSEANGLMIVGASCSKLHRTAEAVEAFKAMDTAFANAGYTPGRVAALVFAGVCLAQSKQTGCIPLFNQALALGRSETVRPLATAEKMQQSAVAVHVFALTDLEREFKEAGLTLIDRAFSKLPAGSEIDLRKGNYCVALNQYQEAERYFQRALRAELAVSAETVRVALLKKQMSQCAMQRFDFVNASLLAHEADDLLTRIAPETLLHAQVLGLLGSLAGVKGDIVTAESFIKRDLELLERLRLRNKDALDALTVLAFLARRRADTQTSDRYMERARAVAVDLQNGSGVDSPAYDFMQGIVSAKDGGEAYVKRRVDNDRLLYPNTPQLAEDLMAFGWLIAGKGDTAQAEANFREANNILDRVAPQSLYVALCDNALAEIMVRKKNLTEAEQLLRAAWTIFQREARLKGSDEAQQKFDDLIRTVPVNLMGTQIALDRSRQALETQESSRAQALEQILLERRALENGSAIAAWKSYRRTQKACDSALNGLSESASNQEHARLALARAKEESAQPEKQRALTLALDQASRNWTRAVAEYSAQRSRADTLWAAIKQKYAAAFTSSISTEQAIHALPEGSLYIAYTVGDTESYVILVRPDGAIDAETVKTSEAALRQAVDGFQVEVTRADGDIAKVQASGKQLFELLFPGRIGDAVKSARRLIISPDGPLWEIPFAALTLPAGQADHYLGEKVPLVFTPSLTLLAQARRSRGALSHRHPVAAILGDPIFGRSPATGAPDSPAQNAANSASAAAVEPAKFRSSEPLPRRLPETRIEAAKIGQIYGTAPLLGRQATEANLRNRIKSADVVHLATHGYLHPTVPMASGLLMTPPQHNASRSNTDNDGVLQAWEIFNQLHLKADTVVLSACETGRGETLAGEGVIGLTRAFQYAGARSVVASLWQVADASTGELMIAFHRFLRSGLPKDEALRRAMATVRQHPRSRHPYYWASFFLTGDFENRMPARLRP